MRARWCSSRARITGERVEARLLESKSKFDRARVTAVLRASASRREPPCAQFGICGGCATQHVDARTQVAAKQRWLEDNLARIGKVTPGAMLAPIHGAEWGYRHRARLSVRYVESKGGALVGFRERKSTYVADMKDCDGPAASGLGLDSCIAISDWQAFDPGPRAAGRNRGRGEFNRTSVSAPVAVHRGRPGAAAGIRGRAAASCVWLQPEGPDSAQPFHPAVRDDLYYDAAGIRPENRIQARRFHAGEPGGQPRARFARDAAARSAARRAHRGSVLRHRQFLAADRARAARR